jgi:hypothetical protein
MQLSSLCAAGNRIEQQIAADRQFFQEAAVSSTALRAMNSLLDAERERWKRLAEIAHPQRGLLESIRMQASGLDQIVEASTATLRGMAAACSPRLPSLDIGFGLDAISALGTIGDFGALGDQHGSLRIHAVPHLPSPKVALGRCRDHPPGRTPLPSHPEAPEQAAGWLGDSLDDKGGRRVLDQLSRFVRSEEIPSDAREGMDFLLALWKLKKTGLNKTEKHRLHLTVLDFLSRQLGVLPSADGLQQLASGLLVPHSHCKSPDPDLAPEIFTTQQLTRKLHSTTDTLKRHAKKACENGPLPQPIPAFPGWFVVSQSDPRGGQGCGWKFQQCRDPKEA